ncbi:MAG: hypothetical protein RLZZ608_325, partial [Actinomycetota bacterium]
MTTSDQTARSASRPGESGDGQHAGYDYAGHDHAGHDHDAVPVRRRARGVHVAWALGATVVLGGLVAVRAYTAEQLDPSIPNPIQDLL